jgi:hypothetical protein
VDLVTPHQLRSLPEDAIHVTNKIILRAEKLIIDEGHLIVINEVSRIPREEENGPKDWIYCLVPPVFAQDVGGIGLAREVCHQDIL